MKRIIGVLAFFVFCITCYFASRDLAALFIIIPLSLLCLSGIEKIGATISFVGVIVVCIVSILWINSKSPLWGERYDLQQNYENAKDAIRVEDNERIKRISMAQVAVKGLLKDPSSAEFSGDNVNSNSVVCGYVNAKNSLGSFSGKSRYIFNGGAYIDDGGKDFSSMWKSLCK